MSAHQRVAESTKQMTDAIYAALDAIDSYIAIVEGITAEQQALPEPNTHLLKRMQQFAKRAGEMVTIIEDQVLDHLNYCTDRVFSVDLAERGEFI